MTHTTWSKVDDFINERFVGDDAALDEALKASAAAGLPEINVAPNQGKLLMLLAQAIGARKILEIGTLGGYSTIWLGRALPTDGKVISLEANADYAEVARSNLARAGLANKVEIRVGRAIETLPTLAGEAPFDLIFIDADKPTTPDYFQCAVTLSRPGSLILVDNVVREGAVLDAESQDRNVLGLRRFYDLAAADPRVSATALQTVGAKGHDGIAILLVISAP